MIRLLRLRDCRLCVPLLTVALSAPAAGQSAPATQPLSPAQQARDTPVSRAVRENAHAVVNISATQVVVVRDLGLGGPSLGDIFDTTMPRQVRTNTVGSGVVIHPAGYILTNAHVAAQAAELRVNFADGSELPGEVLAVRPRDDLAVLRVRPPAGQALHAVRLGRSDDILVGETVIAIGNPVGLQHTVTTGVISAVNRELRISPQVVFEDILQTDAAINPGNSGGPLLNVLGEMIGVTTAIRSGVQNVGFAIPVNRVKRLLPEMLAVETRGRVRLGVEWGEAVSAGERSGVRVTAAEPGSPAEKAGLKAGAVVTAIAGRPTRTAVEAMVAVLEQPVGQPFEVTVQPSAGAAPQSLSLAVENRPEPDGAALARRLLGFDVRPLDARNARRMGVRPDSALMVVALEDGSPAEQAGFEVGDLLTQVEDRSVRNLDELGALLEPVKPGARLFVGMVRVRGNIVLRSGATLTAR